MKKYLLALLGLEIIIFLLNFTPGTYLVGWDTIMPEFNLALNIKRSLFSLWQEYRGLGVLDGMAHSANLIHTFSIALLDAILPEHLVRYIYIHLTHLVGGIGLFLLARKITKHSLASFIGALFYMLNIGVIQMYYAPLEVFATHFAALPLVTLTALNALEKTNRKNLLFFFLTSFLLSQQAFVPTVFIAFSILFLSLLIFSLSNFFKTETEKPKNILKRVALVAFIFFLANAYWALPYAYSALKTPQIIANTRINQFSSEEIFYRNMARGDLASVATLKGFMLDTVEYDQQSKGSFAFMGMWNQYLNSIPGIIITLILLLLTLAGIIFTFIKKQRSLYPFAATAAVAFFFLANDTPLFEQLNTFIRTAFPLVGEAFRFPFTKFITLFAFCLSLFFAYAVSLIRIRKIAVQYAVVGGILVNIFLSALPVFQGYFTSPALRIAIPDYYLQTFEYMKTLPHDRRVAVLPAETFWNWGYTSWGFRGSGFIWYGIPQALMYRAFDPWSLYNEEFYNELSHSINTENPELFTAVLQKYDIHYLLLDESIINSLSKQPINYDKLQAFLAQTQAVHKEKQFGKIALYKTNATPGYVSTLSVGRTISAFPSFTSGYADSIYAAVGNYISDPHHITVFTPFSSLATEKLQKNHEFSLSETSDSFILSPRPFKPVTLPHAQLILPSLFQNEFLVPVKASVSGNQLLLTIQNPDIFINKKHISLPRQEIRITANTLTSIKQVTFADIEHTVDPTSPQAYSYLLNTNATSLILSDGQKSEMVSIDVTDQPHDPLIIPLNENVISSFSIRIPKINSPLAVQDLNSTKYTIKETKNTTGSSRFPPLMNETKDKNGITLTSRNGSLALAFYQDNLFHQAAYIGIIDSTHENGLPVNMYIDNPFQDRAVFETRLDKQKQTNTLMLPPTEQYFKGYGFHLIVKSEGSETAKAIIHDFRLYPFLSPTLQGIRIANTQDPIFRKDSADKQPLVYKKNITGTYEMKNPGGDTILVLSQAYDSGWSAYALSDANPLAKLVPPLFGKKLEHVLVNNWANGWNVQNSAGISATNQQSIVILYLPSYLQYIGIACTFMGGILLGGSLLIKRIRGAKDSQDQVSSSME